MRYFAMINGERRGPFELHELAAAGVRPSTYVWCKGMSDWEKAEEVADICRHFRRTLFDRMHPQRPGPEDAPRNIRETDGDIDKDPYASVPLRFRNMVRRSGEAPPDFDNEEQDLSQRPAPLILPAFMLMFFCFPITGVIAVYFAMRAHKAWTEAERSESKNGKQLYTEEERKSLRSDALDSDRQARMWIGITFFLGMIMLAFVGYTLF